MTDIMPGAYIIPDIASVEYKVLKPVAKLPFAAGETFKAWPWGDMFAHVHGAGPICTIADLKDWVANGVIEQMSAPARRI